MQHSRLGMFVCVALLLRFYDIMGLVGLKWFLLHLYMLQRSFVSPTGVYMFVCRFSLLGLFL